MTPPKPFKRIRAGYEIPAGAYRKGVDEEHWRLVPGFEVGQKVTSETVCYAELVVPDLYRVAQPDEIVKPEDMYWEAGRFEWLPVRPRAYELRGKVSEVRDRLEERHFYVIKLDETNEDSRTVPLPKFHRPLMFGELMRSSDKLIYQGTREWTVVGNFLAGKPVKEFTEALGYMRMCRDMGDRAVFMFVGQHVESDRESGFTTSRYLSAEEARKLFMRLGESAVGAVLTHEGDVLYATD